MSLLSRDHWHLALSPARVDIVRRVAGLLRRTVQTAEVVPCTPDAGREPWRAALQAVAGAFSHYVPRGGDCSVVLSNHFVRYTIVPWARELRSEAEVETYARLRFRETFGADAAGRWEVRVGTPVFGAARLACAVDRGLMNEVRSLCATHRLRLAAVRPLLAASFDRWRKRLRGERFWFVVAEEGRLCLAGIDGAAWRTVASQRVGGDLQDEMLAMLERESLVMPRAGTDTLYLFARDRAAEQPVEIPGVTVRALGASAPRGATERDLALTRVLA